MKKHKLMLAIVLSLMTVMTACKKEETSSSSLVGTVWFNEDSDITYDENGGSHTYYDTTRLFFKTETTGELIESHYVTNLSEENYIDTFPFTYTYSHPHGVITATDDGETRNLTFTVKNNMIDLRLSDAYFPVYFYKQ